MSGRPAGNIDGFGLDERRHRGGVADGNDGIKAWAAAKPGAGRRAKRSLSRRLLIVAVATVLVVTLTVWGAALTRHISSSSVAARLTAKSAARAGTTAPDAGARSELPAGTFFALPSTTVPSTTVPNTTVPIAVGATGAGSPQVSGGGAALSATWVQGTVPATIAADAGSRPELSAGTVSPAPSPTPTKTPSATPTKTPSATPTKTAASQPASSGPSAAPSGGTPSGGGVPGNVPGWQLTYSTAFPGNSLPSKWGAYSGQPGGDPDGNWDPVNVAVSGGELHFYANNGSTGGVDFFGNPQTDGMYLVRMKGDYEPGINISDILLLWPDSNVWPPEIDFFEDSGGARSGYQATVHLGPNGDNSNQVHVNVSNDATQWHTYGVQWTPSTITFTVDGQSVGSVSQRDTSSWPNIAMNLDLQSQNLGPSQPANGTETMTVAWVAEYAMS
jgi:hypothetical protein